MNVTIMPVGMLGTNCYLLESEGGSCAIIDPGAQPDKISAMLEKSGVQVKYILLTHCHFDHIGGVNKLAARYPEAELYIGAKDRETAGDPERCHGDPITGGAMERLRTVSEGQELPLDELTIRVVETPGHTRGGVVYLVEDVMFSGDTLFRAECGRCDLYGGDYEAMKRSLRKLAELPGDYTVYPGHGESSILGWERKNNRYMLEGLA